jgi:hypothetical protein
MDLNDYAGQKARLEAKAQEQIQDVINGMRSELDKSNEDVSRRLQKSQQPEDAELETPTVVNSASSPKKEATSFSSKPLIYFSYPYAEPSWVVPLREVLTAAGYLTYNPANKVDEQFGQQDISSLNGLSLRLVKALCPLLAIPEETLLPFDAIWKLIQSSDAGDNFGIVFSRLWFLVRSSIVICDLTKEISADNGQELLYARQLGVPVVGLFPTSGLISPFTHKSTTVLFSGTDLLQLLPLIRGYAPL